MRNLMRNLILLFIALGFSLGVQGQRQTTKKVSTAVEGNETVYIEIVASGAYQSLATDLVCNQTGGTSDGTITLEAALDTNWFNVQPDDIEMANAISGDTLTISDGATWYVELFNPASEKYRFKIEGTSGDSTLVTVKYYLK